MLQSAPRTLRQPLPGTLSSFVPDDHLRQFSLEQQHEDLDQLLYLLYPYLVTVTLTFCLGPKPVCLSDQEVQLVSRFSSTTYTSIS